MTSKRTESQFSLRWLFGLVTLAALGITFFRRGGAGVVDLLVVGFALFWPIASYGLHQILAERTTRITALLSTLSVMALTTAIVFAWSAVALLYARLFSVLWIPQIACIAFFEWCELEERRLQNPAAKKDETVKRPDINE